MAWATAEVDATEADTKVVEQERVTTTVGLHNMLSDEWSALQQRVAQRADEPDLRGRYHRILDEIFDADPRIAQGHVFSITLH